jgi:hypothetical protein
MQHGWRDNLGENGFNGNIKNSPSVITLERTVSLASKKGGEMKTRIGVGLFVASLVVLIAACASPTAAPTAAPPQSAFQPTRPAAPTSAPAATRAAEPTKPAARASDATPESSASNAQIAAAQAQRKIIKNANFHLLVENADVATDRLTGIAGDFRGYIISSRTFYENGLKAATVTFAVPVDRFEETLRRVRGIAIKVEQESASGQDVTDQYIDLESQVRNLEATADRIREFLKKAQTVEEALKVNQQLSQVEKEIETLKGKLNYLGDRSAFSTVTVEVREPRPTPTPTLTPTITPTPTATPTLTPVVWRPDQTFTRAVETQTTLMQVLIEMVIWIAVVLLPYALIVLGGLWVFARVMRWLGTRGTKKVAN